MLLSAKNLNEITYRTKRHQLKKADAEIILALVSGAMMDEAQKITDANPEPEKKDDFNGVQQKTYDKKMAAYSKAVKDYGFKILSASVIDDKGDPVFKNVEEFEALALAIQEEIMDAVYEYNGMTSAGLDDAVKN